MVVVKGGHWNYSHCVPKKNLATSLAAVEVKMELVCSFEQFLFPHQVLIIVTLKTKM
jgi:hypothetical protein